MKEFLNRFNLTLIIAAYCVIVLALFKQLNIYIVIFGAVCAVWRSAHFYGWVALMPRVLLSIVAIASSLVTVGLLYQQGVFNIMLHLIFLGFSLKFLELRSVRDVYFFVNTGLILIALFFIFNTSIVAAIIASCLILLLLAILLSLHTQHIRKNIFLALLLKSCLLSLPLAILLFVVMPRLPSLWKMPVQKQATTGLSDTVSPGEIAKLSRSSALAFRVTFNGEVAIQNARYWRAMTLDEFDGKTWSQSEALKQEEFEAKGGVGRSFYQTEAVKKQKSEYELIIEPHYNYWVPVLDYTLTPTGLVSLSDYSLRSDKPIVARKSIIVSQMSYVNTFKLTAEQRKQFTQLPTQSSTQLLEAENTQTDAWIARNLTNGLSKVNILEKLLNDFSERFRYTLDPPLLGKKQIDDFLFNSKAGFCVHFASSYLYVARRLGFPVRMVTGYLGGEWQVSEGFFTIRQYDAHAWVEIWRNNEWQRVDPTAYVAPERVASGLQAGLTNSNEFLADEYFSLQKWRSVELINMLRGHLAQVDYLWARYVVNFDNQTQIKLMQNWLAKVPWLKLTYAVMLLMAIIFVLLLIVIFKPWKIKKISFEDRVYLQLQVHFIKLGFKREPGQLISEYCLLLGDKFKLPATLCQSFAIKYNAIKYQPKQSPDQHKKQIKQLLFISKQLRKK
jgi:transglutaminase-like putative cysteine protease